MKTNSKLLLNTILILSLFNATAGCSSTALESLTYDSLIGSDRSQEEPVTEKVLVFDEAQTNIIAAIGLHRMISSYNGPAIRLRRDADGQSKDFSFQSNGYLNRSEIITWLGSPTTPGRVITWYDQSGNGKNLTTVSTTNTAGGGATKIQDYPLLIIPANKEEMPFIKFSGNRMDLFADFTQSHTLLTRLRTVSGENALSYSNSEVEIRYPNANHELSVSESGTTVTLPVGFAKETWSTFAFRYDNATTAKIDMINTNGAISQSQILSKINLLTSTDRLHLGWISTGTTKWNGQISELLILGKDFEFVHINKISDISKNRSELQNESALSETALQSKVPSGTFTPIDSTKLMGVNLSGAENKSLHAVVNFDYVFPGSSQLDYYKNKGMTVIRLPINLNRLQPRRNEAFNSFELQKIHNVIEGCLTRGMKVIIDPHNYGMLNDNMGISRVIGRDPLMPSSTLANFWSRFATIYKNYPNVIFNLMNEPYMQTAAQWKTVAVDSVNAIRATGATHLIMIPGTSWTGAHSWVSSGNAAAWVGFTDSNFVFELHQYLDSDKSGTHDPCVANYGSRALQTFTNWARANNYKGFLGEVGWSTDSTCPAEGRAILQYMKDNSDIWIGWAYFAGGPWMSAYHFTVEPTAGVDTPQMNVLLEFL